MPEYHAAGSIIWSQCVAANAAASTGGAHSPLLALIVVPTAFSARFRAAFVYLTTGIAVALVAAISLVSNPSAVLHDPAPVLVVIVVLIGVAAATHALSGAELWMRDVAILDPLTGLLNQQGLKPRFQELV